MLYSRPLALVAIASTLLCAQAKADQMDLSSAFRAAFGSSPPLARTVMNVAGSGHGYYQGRLLPMHIVPSDLIAIGGGSYALVAMEQQMDAAHLYPGAVSVTYLKQSGRGWSVEGQWPEFVWTGNFGIPTDGTWTLSTGRRILLMVPKSYCGGGQCWNEIAVLTFGPKAPHLIGSLTGGAAILATEYPGCPTYSYVAHMGRPHSANAVLSVRYSGWTAPSGFIEPRRPFSQTVDYVVSGSGFIARPPLKLPGQDCPS
jgi:hypothetical protein